MNYLLQNRRFLHYTCILFSLVTVMYSQTAQDIINHRKYWYYKSRLNNDFIKVGTAAGESFPFMQRGVGASTFTNTSYSKMKIGDGTSILGYYIAMLAMEYYLLSQNVQNTDSVLYELTCALYAINRVDIAAEKKMGYSGGLLNGFFIRDDVPCDDIYYLPLIGNPPYASYDWSSDNRCDHPDRLGGIGQPFPGEYNGIDFLLYHNLWYCYNRLVQNKTIYFTNLSHVWISKNNGWFYGGNPPFNSTTLQTIINTPIKVDAFETVTIEKTEIPIFKDSYIRAGKWIHLKPGTWLRPGSINDTCVECIAHDEELTFQSTMRLYIAGYSSACETGSVCDGCRINNSKQDSLRIEFSLPHFFHYVSSEKKDVYVTNHLHDMELLLNNIPKDSTLNVFIENKIPIHYPDPTSDYVFINYLPNNTIISYEVSDVFGHVLLKETSKLLDENLPLQINVMSLNNGVFF